MIIALSVTLVDTQTLKLASQNVRNMVGFGCASYDVGIDRFGRPSGFKHFSNVKFEFGCLPDPFRTLHPTSVFQ